MFARFHRCNSIPRRKDRHLKRLNACRPTAKRSQDRVYGITCPGQCPRQVSSRQLGGDFRREAVTAHFLPSRSLRSTESHAGVINRPNVIPNTQTPILLHCSTYAPSNTKPGPGQTPYHPHANPQMTLPTTNRQSTSVFVGNSNTSLRHGFCACFNFVVHAIKFGNNAPTATNARDGSNDEDIGNERKFWILEG